MDSRKLPPGELRARIEFELMNGPYRTDRQLAAYLGCRVVDVVAATYALGRRTTRADGWTVSDSQRLDGYVHRYRKALRLGSPPVLPLPWPADDEAQAVA
ncbi:hypothetical protein [Nocardia farcinica]|uniref:hypothetical protein n=1 Tax=Nocardia farcinica TaxID=37329 RepID=UPI0024588D60|nr:hypothetical protein [Nocardia farcinica]